MATDVDSLKGLDERRETLIDDKKLVLNPEEAEGQLQYIEERLAKKGPDNFMSFSHLLDSLLENAPSSFKINFADRLNNLQVKMIRSKMSGLFYVLELPEQLKIYAREPEVKFYYERQSLYAVVREQAFLLIRRIKALDLSDQFERELMSLKRFEDWHQGEIAFFDNDVEYDDEYEEPEDEEVNSEEGDD